MSEFQPGTPERAEPGPQPDGPAARAEPNLHPEHAPDAAAPASGFAAGPEVPRFAPGPEVPRFGDAMPGAGEPEPPYSIPPEDVPPPFAAQEPAAPFAADTAPTLAQRWGRRLALAVVGLATAGTVIGGLLWYNGQRKVDRSLEVLAMSARSADAPAAPAPAPAPVALPNAAPAPVAPQPAPTPSAPPPLVLLPADQAGADKPAAQPRAPAVRKAAASSTKARAAKAGAKSSAKKKPAAKGGKAGARKAAAKPKQRRCKRGQLVRECLGLPE